MRWRHFNTLSGLAQTLLWGNQNNQIKISSFQTKHNNLPNSKQSSPNLKIHVMMPRQTRSNKRNDETQHLGSHQAKRPRTVSSISTPTPLPRATGDTGADMDDSSQISRSQNVCHPQSTVHYQQRIPFSETDLNIDPRLNQLTPFTASQPMDKHVWPYV
jgi:hypothetical protein